MPDAMRIGHNDRRWKYPTIRPSQPGAGYPLGANFCCRRGNCCQGCCVESYPYRSDRSDRSDVSYSRSDNLNYRRSDVFGARSDRSAFFARAKRGAFSEDIFVGSFEPDPHAVLETALGRWRYSRC